jgi:hypothetical protein
MSADLLEHENWVLAADPTAHGLRTRMQLMDRLSASIITDIAAFEASSMWAIEGYASVNAWVADHGRCSNFRLLPPRFGMGPCRRDRSR